MPSIDFTIDSSKAEIGYRQLLSKLDALERKADTLDLKLSKFQIRFAAPGVIQKRLRELAGDITLKLKADVVATRIKTNLASIQKALNSAGPVTIKAIVKQTELTSRKNVAAQQVGSKGAGWFYDVPDASAMAAMTNASSEPKKYTAQQMQNKIWQLMGKRDFRSAETDEWKKLDKALTEAQRQLDSQRSYLEKSAEAEPWRNDVRGAYSRNQQYIDNDQATKDSVEALSKRFREALNYTKAEEAAAAATDKSTKTTDKQTKAVEKATQSVSKQSGELQKYAQFMNSVWIRIGVTMSGIAATIFVLTQVVQWVKSFVSVGASFDAEFKRIGLSVGVAKENLAGFKDTVQDVMGGTKYQQNDIAEALAAISNNGYDASKSVTMLKDTLAIASASGMDMADAARLAAKNTFGLADHYKKLNEELSKTGDAKLDEVYNKIKLIGIEFYNDNEPTIIKVLDNLGNWIEENKSGILGLLEAIGGTLSGLLSIVETILYLPMKAAGAVRDTAKALYSQTKEQKLAIVEKKIADLKTEISAQAKDLSAESDPLKRMADPASNRSRGFNPSQLMDVAMNKELYKDKTVEGKQLTVQEKMLKQLELTRDDLKKELLPVADPGTVATMDEMFKAGKIVYDQLGLMTTAYYQSLLDSHDQNMALLKKANLSIHQSEIERRMIFDVGQMGMKLTMDSQKELFRAIGRVSDKEDTGLDYWQNRKDIEAENIKRLNLPEKDADILTKFKYKMLY